MTKLLYQDDSYLKEFDTNVVSVDGNKIELERTVFYPEGGGQPGDVGVLNSNGADYNVVGVKKENGKIMHELGNEGLKKGDKVKGAIDWQRRYKFMRMHTASHSLAAIFNKESGALITGNQIGEEQTRFDFNLENFDRELIDKLVEMTNKLMAQGKPVNISYKSREEAMQIPAVVKLAKGLPESIKTLRLVEIEGIDLQADGGTHVRNTSEVGNIKVERLENKGKNNRRIYFSLAK